MRWRMGAGRYVGLMRLLGWSERSTALSGVMRGHREPAGAGLEVVQHVGLLGSAWTHGREHHWPPPTCHGHREGRGVIGTVDCCPDYPLGAARWGACECRDSGSLFGSPTPVDLP